MPGKELLPEKRAQIVALHSLGLSNRAISSHLSVPRSTVGYTLQRDAMQQGANQFHSLKRSGRPRASSTQTDRLIRRQAILNPTIAASEISVSLPDELSVRTIQRRLQRESGLNVCRPALKPTLSAKNIRDRLNFATTHAHWGVDEWRNVQFSDETLISQFKSYKPHVRRPRGQRNNPKYIIPTAKNPPKVMIWGSIAASGRGGLFMLPANTTMKSQNYLELLQDKLPQWMALRHTNVFQQDGAPCHTAKIVMRWFDSQAFSVLSPWPGSSPDLNPIENAWVLLKKKVAKRNPTSMENLKEVIREVWVLEMSQEYCRTLIDSMPKRIQAVITSRGGYTKY
jgi:transposase